MNNVSKKKQKSKEKVCKLVDKRLKKALKRLNQAEKQIDDAIIVGKSSVQTSALFASITPAAMRLDKTREAVCKLRDKIIGEINPPAPPEAKAPEVLTG